jgi:hypothetical protein
LQPWDNCKRLKFGGYLPHPGNHLTPSVELTTWYLVAPLSLLQPRRQGILWEKSRYKPNKSGVLAFFDIFVNRLNQSFQAILTQ